MKGRGSSERRSIRLVGGTDTGRDPVRAFVVLSPGGLLRVPAPRMGVDTGAVADAVDRIEERRVVLRQKRGGPIRHRDLGIHAKRPHEVRRSTRRAFQSIAETARGPCQLVKPGPGRRRVKRPRLLIRFAVEGQEDRNTFLGHVTRYPVESSAESTHNCRSACGSSAHRNARNPRAFGPESRVGREWGGPVWGLGGSPRRIHPCHARADSTQTWRGACGCKAGHPSPWVLRPANGSSEVHRAGVPTRAGYAISRKGSPVAISEDERPGHSGDDPNCRDDPACDRAAATLVGTRAGGSASHDPVLRRVKGIGVAAYLLNGRVTSIPFSFHRAERARPPLGLVRHECPRDTREYEKGVRRRSRRAGPCSPGEDGRTEMVRQMPSRCDHRDPLVTPSSHLAPSRCGACGRRDAATRTFRGWWWGGGASWNRTSDLILIRDAL